MNHTHTNKQTKKLHDEIYGLFKSVESILHDYCVKVAEHMKKKLKNRNEKK